MIENIDVFVNRSSEVFNAFIENKGNESKLAYLIVKYSKEDKKEYTYDKINTYLNAYLNNENINKADKDLYKKIITIPDELLLKRGKEIVEALIKSNNNFDDIMYLAKKYAREDGKVKPYSMFWMKKMQNYYLNNGDEFIINQYNYVISSSKYYDYDDTLIKELLNNNMNNAIKFIKNIGISKISIINLKNKYIEKNNLTKQEKKFLNKVINSAFKEKSSSLYYESGLMRIDKLKKTIEEYLVSDEEDISSFAYKFGLSNYSFEEALIDAETSNDLVLKSLIDKYREKEIYVAYNKKQDIDKILQGIMFGIVYNGKQYEFNYFDYLTMTKLSSKQILKYANVYYEKKYINLLVDFFKQYEKDRVYDNIDEMIKFTKFNSVTNEDKWKVAIFLKNNGYKLSSNLFKDALKRFKQNALIIE